MASEVIVERERRHGLFFRFLVNSAAVFLAAQLIPGVHVDGFVGVVLAVILLAIVNTFVRPVLLFLTLPLTVLTLGLFLLVVNGLTLMLAAWLAGSAFDIDGIGAAMLAWLAWSVAVTNAAENVALFVAISSTPSEPWPLVAAAAHYWAGFVVLSCLVFCVVGVVRRIARAV